MTIRTLFDPSRPIDRRIEKVIQYDARDPQLLKQEIAEYQVTEAMTRSFEKLLDAIDLGMSEASNEIGVWASGFYGSGKSSFTKYLGFALDDSYQIDGKPFLHYLQDRCTSTTLSQRLGVVAARHRPAVIMLDLASEQLAGASMAEISTVLYAKVMQWAGYSQDRKVAYLELMLERDGLFDAFKGKIAQVVPGVTWEQIKNQPLVANQLASQLAAEIYPAVYPSSKSFQDQRIDEFVKNDDLARDMIALVRRRSGREKIIFILDEVGQYVGSRDELILNLDGLAKNLKNLGGGKVWLIATAQQTLTEDDPRAQLNTPKLFKLQARFPVPVDLEASDIRLICYLRLLTKAAAGKAQLDALYDQFGQQLRFNTQLHNTRYYQRDLDKQAFSQLYPFLPQHFDILLELLGRLAKTMGGMGLRSAIKVIQDVLISRESQAGSGGGPLADQPVGTLATTVTFYDALRRDLHRQRALREVVESVDKAARVFGADSPEAQVAKTVAILQALEDFPVTRENIAALLHPSPAAASQRPAVEQAVKNLLDEETVPIAEIDGHLRFMSEAVSGLEQARRALAPILAERTRIINDLLKDLFTPLPRASLLGTRTVQCGIKTQGVLGPVSILGDKEELQLLLEFTPEQEFAAHKQGRLADSTQPVERNTLFLIGLEPGGLQQQVEEIYRGEEIFNQHRNKTVEREVADYLNAQQQRAEGLRGDLARRLQQGLEQGSFIFRGRPHAVATLGANLFDAARKQLEEAACEVFSNYPQAPVQAEAGLAERFLKTDRLDRIESKNDPLSLVSSNGQIDTGHAALRSIVDTLNQTGREEGRVLLDKFSRAPYGWSKDTLRYLIAALLVGGEIRLRVSGEDITVRGATAVESLKTNAAFNRVGVDLRDGGIPPESLIRAAERLLELTGEDVLPLEDDISKVVTRRFPDLQRDYAYLPSDLRNLQLAGPERADGIGDRLSEILKGDASDAAARLGSEDCALFDDLKWARELDKALKGHLPDAVRRANRYILALPRLPAVGPLADLQHDCKDDLAWLTECFASDEFFTQAPDIQTRVTRVEGSIAIAAAALATEYDADLQAEKRRLEQTPYWPSLGGDDQERFAAQLDALQIQAAPTLDGIRSCLDARYPLQQRTAQLAQEIGRIMGEQAQPVTGDDPPVTAASGYDEDQVDAGEALILADFQFPAQLESLAQLERLIERLTALKARFTSYSKIIFKR